jgi:hypothetical protein
LGHHQRLPIAELCSTLPMNDTGALLEWIFLGFIIWFFRFEPPKVKRQLPLANQSVVILCEGNYVVH